MPQTTLGCAVQTSAWTRRPPSREKAALAAASKSKRSGGLERVGQDPASAETATRLCSLPRSPVLHEMCRALAKLRYAEEALDELRQKHAQMRLPPQALSATKKTTRIQKSLRSQWRPTNSFQNNKRYDIDENRNTIFRNLGLLQAYMLSSSN